MVSSSGRLYILEAKRAPSFFKNQRSKIKQKNCRLVTTPAIDVAMQLTLHALGLSKEDLQFGVVVGQHFGSSLVCLQCFPGLLFGHEQITQQKINVGVFFRHLQSRLDQKDGVVYFSSGAVDQLSQIGQNDVLKPLWNHGHGIEEAILGLL